MPQFNGFTSKIISIAKKAAPIGGAAKAWLSAPMDAGPLSSVPKWIAERVSKFKFADPIKTTTLALEQPDHYPIMEGVTAAIGGAIGEEILDGLDFKGVGAVKGLATVWKRYGVSAFVNGIVAAYVYLAPFNPHGQGYTEGYERAASEPAGFGDSAYRTRATAHIRSAAGQGVASPR